MKTTTMATTGVKGLLKTQGSKITRLAGKAGVLLKKYSPEICIGVGTVAIVGGVILACRATLRVEEILDEHEEKMELIEDTVERAEEEDLSYSEKDAVRDKYLQTAKTGVKLAQLYAPSVLCIGLGLGLIYYSHHIMKARGIALMAAYEALDKGFKDYRERVRQELGDDKDIQFLTGAESVEEDAETGDKKLNGVSGLPVPSVYARFFDESSKYFQKDHMSNKKFLIFQQNAANDKLYLNGHLFLNEVFDMLGLDRTPEGALVGWVRGSGDDYVDFGLFDGDNERKRAFINGYERAVLLDFNVDGVIYDKI